MAQPGKKKTLSDFFRPYGQSKQFQTKTTIPQKRASPSPEDGRVALAQVDGATAGPSTPSKQRIHRPTVSPLTPSQARVSTPTSASLPIRTPKSKSGIRPPSTYKVGRLFSSEKDREQKTTIRSPSPKQQTQSSFDFPPPSTQNVLRAGKVVAVRDSDDDSDSLASLDDIFGKKSDEDDTSVSSPLEQDEAHLETERRRLLSTWTHGRSEAIVGKEKLRQIYALEKAHKFDISALLNDHYDDQEINTNVEKTRDRYESSFQDLEGSGRKELDQDLLASLVQHAGGDEEKVARLMGAVERTEALSTEKSFSFFDLSELPNSKPGSRDVPDFPKCPILDGLFNDDDPDARSRAVLAGFVAEQVQRGSLPDEVLAWIFQAAQSEPNDDVMHSYLECLKKGSAGWTRIAISGENVQVCFQRLGAHRDNIEDGQPIEPRRQPLRKRKEQDPTPLLFVLDIFRVICSHMDFLALSKLSSILCRLTLDVDLMSNWRVSTAVEQGLSQLLDLPEREASLHVAQHILDDMRSRLKDPNLQAQLLSHLMPSSPLACKLRIKLAHIFLLGPDKTVPESMAEPQPISLTTLANHISKSPSFATSSRRTKLNYIHLRSLTHILDIAISDGGRPLTFPSRAAENTFNASVDDLADTVREIYESINDAGATHMTRTEAKDVLRSLYWRLLYAVRTEVKPKKHIFDGETGLVRDAEEARVEQRGKDFMNNFLARMKEKRMEGEKAAVAGSQPVSDGSRSESEVMIREQLGLSQ